VGPMGRAAWRVDCGSGYELVALSAAGPGGAGRVDSPVVSRRCSGQLVTVGRAGLLRAAAAGRPDRHRCRWSACLGGARGRLRAELVSRGVLDPCCAWSDASAARPAGWTRSYRMVSRWCTG
jgi:hypothetical protein